MAKANTDKKNETKNTRVIKPTALRALHMLNRTLTANADALKGHKDIITAARALHTAIRAAVKLDDCPL